MTDIGVISDTHGLLRPEATRALEGSERILHIGDVDEPEILAALARFAPVTAVRGNCDRGAWAMELPETEVVDVGGTLLYMVHDIGTLNLDPAEASISVVLFGHTHEPLIEKKDGVLYLNPGSAGPRRFSLPVSVARLRVDPDGVEAKIVELDV